MRLLTLSLVTQLVFFSLGAAAAPTSGTFVATQVCPLYQSKNKLTNPNDSFSQIGAQYAIIEFLGPIDTPTWYRLKTDNRQSPERWISANCGKRQGTASNNMQPVSPITTSADTSTSCSTENRFDANLLVLNWQNAFCEIKGKNKPECSAMEQTKDDIRWLKFSLHGLWPTRASCGIQYGFCSQVKQAERDFCRYPALALNAQTQKRLNNIMPSADFNSCLERHEWWKHGSCRDTDPNRYYTLASSLTEQFNQSTFVTEFIANHIGKQVSRQAVDTAFDASFGKQSYRRLTLQCNRGLLLEIRISLPQEITEDAMLTTLLSSANKTGKGNCPEQFYLDSAGE